MLLGPVVPGVLAAMPPGPELARVLADLDIARVPNDDIVDVVQARSRQLAHEQARMYEALSEVICRRPFAGPGEVRREDHPDQYGSDEVRAALCWTRRAAEAETDLAFTLVHRLPLVQQALLAGDIDRGKAWVFAQHLADLSPEQIVAISVALLPLAPRLTAGQLAARIKRMILELDPAYYERRYRKAVRERMVVAYLNADGTAVISASGLPADEAAAAWERLNTVARAARHDGHPGTLHQIRADLVLGLLDGSLNGLDREEILQALVERFVGSVEPAAEELPGTLVPVGRRAGAGGSSPRSTSPGGAVPGSPEPGSRVSGGPESGVPGPGGAGSDGSGSGGAGPDGRAGLGADASRGSVPGAALQALDLSGGPETEPIAGAPNARDRSEMRTASGVAEPDDPAGRGRAGPAEDQRVGIEVRVPLSTLLELDDRAGEIPAWGPITASAARSAVARQRRAQWRWVVVDDDGHLWAEGITRRRPTTSARSGPRGGIVELQVPATLLATLDADAESYGPWAGVIADIATRFEARRQLGDVDLDAHPDDRFPRAALRRHVQVRDRTCIHPGCRSSAVRADLDHTLDHTYGGATTQDDLSPLCRHHHVLKSEGGWRLEQPEPGRFVWRSPLGRIYPVDPEPILPPLPEPVLRDLDPGFDEPALDGDYAPDLTVRERAPPPTDPAPARPRSPGVDSRDDPPPF